MPIYQNSSVNTSYLILGNCKIEVAPYGTTAASSAWTNLGAGIVNSFKHVPTKYSVQAGMHLTLLKVLLPKLHKLLVNLSSIMLRFCLLLMVVLFLQLLLLL